MNTYDKKIKKLKNEIIAYLLTISLFLSGTGYIVSKEKNKPKEKLYLTKEYTYALDKLNIHSEYSSLENTDSVLIRKIYPWVIEGNECKRKICTYKIDNMLFNDIISLDNYEELINNINYIEEYEYAYKNELRDKDRYEESYYEVVEITQNEDDYIEKNLPVKKETVGALLTEILLYLLILNINNGPLTESIINNICEIDKYKYYKTKTLKKK